jgi:cellulose biosynthesis protein BcsQ
MSLIISIANQKGGVGKSQVTMMLAAALSQQFKKRVAVVDLDKQKSIHSTRQLDIRAYDEMPPNYFAAYSMTTKEYLENIENLKNGHEIIFVDVAGKLDDNLPPQLQDVSPALFTCDFVLIPFVAGNHNTRSASEFFHFVRRIQGVQKANGLKPLQIGIFLNRIKTGTAQKTLNRDLDALRFANPDIIVFEKGLKELGTFNTADSVTCLYDETQNGAVGNFTAFCNDFINKLKIEI